MDRSRLHGHQRSWQPSTVLTTTGSSCYACGCEADRTSRRRTARRPALDDEASPSRSRGRLVAADQTRVITSSCTCTIRAPREESAPLISSIARDGVCVLVTRSEPNRRWRRAKGLTAGSAACVCATTMSLIERRTPSSRTMVPDTAHTIGHSRRAVLPVLPAHATAMEDALCSADPAQGFLTS